ncbi:hypothetical protein [Actinomadura rayongensis]|uniref:Uncharacterized protein n=1 Tax=Actinomadura rayongensis TaxID=1429076 RepID=A0A6I4WE10_9ACTN|nr:hypothetical protein [Actinomadura rayongensis]MXQ66495.1 hypothetical protein [Actinomadura rayongensis]
MTDGDRGRAVQAGPEDAARLVRLREEIQGRLEELALIHARLVGRRLDPTTVRKFVPVNTKEELSGGYHHIEIVGDGAGCAIYCDSGEVIAESPCGQAGDNPCS